MRLNQYIARHSGLSRRGADAAIEQGRIIVNGSRAHVGQALQAADVITLDGRLIVSNARITIMLNKPVGYVCSRNGQGSKTVYDLLPESLHHLKPAGRLDKDSSGLLLLTNDGELANRLTHPRYRKLKVYEVGLDKPLAEQDLQKLKLGIDLEDGISKFTEISSLSKLDLRVSLKEGRNRQIRRTFKALDYRVIRLHRTIFGEYSLDQLKSSRAGKDRELWIPLT